MAVFPISRNLSGVYNSSRYLNFTLFNREFLKIKEIPRFLSVIIISMCDYYFCETSRDRTKKSHAKRKAKLLQRKDKKSTIWIIAQASSAAFVSALDCIFLQTLHNSSHSWMCSSFSFANIFIDSTVYLLRMQNLHVTRAKKKEVDRLS